VENDLSLSAAEALAAVQARMGRHLGAADSRTRRAPPIDIVARMSAIRARVAA
jgi:hypothetical protein